MQLTLLAQAFLLWPAGPLARVYKDARPPEGTIGGPVEIRCARNEWEGGQFAITALSDLHNVSVELTELKHSSGYALPRKFVKWNFVGLIPLTKDTPHTPERELERRAPCEVPDPLLDVKSLDIPKGESRSVWITVYVPADAPPGEYRGRAVAKCQEEKDEIEIRLHVWPFVLPKKRGLLVTNWFSPSNIAKAHNVGLWSEEFWPVFEKWLKFLNEHGQNVFWVPWRLVEVYKEPDGRLSFDFSKFDRYVEACFKVGAERIEIQHVAHPERGWGTRVVLATITAVDRKTGKPVRLPPEEGLGPLLRALEKHLEERGWLERAMIHISDEPTESNRPSWIEASKFVKRWAPRLKRIDAIETIGFDGHLEVWVPKLSHLHRWLPHYKRAQKQGAELWFYTCCHPWGLYPNRFLDFPLAKTRVLHWMNFAFGLQGYLHWGLNWWPKDPFGEPRPNLPPGDTHIVYPGKDGPLSSLRFEAMRDGLDDYEYLRLLVERTRELQRRLGPAAEEIPADRRAMELCRRVVKGFADYERDGERLLRVREEVANEIVNLDKPPLALVTTEPPEWERLFEGPIAVLVRGVVERGATVKVNGREVEVDEDGQFSVITGPDREGRVVVEVEKDGNVKRIERRFEVVRG